MSNQISKEDAVTEMNAKVIKLSKCWHGLRLIGETWNIKSARVNLDNIHTVMTGLSHQWEEANRQLAEQLEAIRVELGSPAYANELERELKAVGIQFSGDFPQYVLPPFKLVISLDGLEARLSLGRKSEKTADLNPRQLAQWAGIRYKKVLARKFNATAFMKDLLEAYHIANRLHFRDKEPSYGRAVPLQELYNILTIRQTSRQDYPLQFFVFDLGLLKESGVMELEKYRFEFGFARDQKKAIVVVDSIGRESFFSSLTVYKVP